MKNCPNCGELLGDSVEICYACRYNNKLGRVLTMEESRQIREDRQKEIAKQQSKNEEQEKQFIKKHQVITAIKNKRMRFLYNTGYNFEGYQITEYIGLISSEIALGTGFLSELSVSINDALGSQSNIFGEKLSQAKKTVLDNLTVKAIEKGANAVIGLDYDIFTLVNNMIIVSLNATAVYIERKPGNTKSSRDFDNK